MRMNRNPFRDRGVERAIPVAVSSDSSPTGDGLPIPLYIARSDVSISDVTPFASARPRDGVRAIPIHLVEGIFHRIASRERIEPVNVVGTVGPQLPLTDTSQSLPREINTRLPVPVYIAGAAENVISGYSLPEEQIQERDDVKVYVQRRPFPSGTYAAKYFEHCGANVIGLWPFTELSGSTAINLQGASIRDGGYSNIILDDVDGPVAGERSPEWAGADDEWCDVYSSNGFSGLVDVFNPDGDWTVSLWMKVDTSITIGLRGLFNISKNVLNEIHVRTDVFTPNRLTFIYSAGGVTVSKLVSSVDATTWRHIAMVREGDTLKVYLDGVQQGSALTGLGVFDGPISPSFCCVGNKSTVGHLAFQGNLAYFFVGQCALSSAQILDLADPTP